ncbi:hypothetical protein Clacol_002767 [Clathrus columnatus]|uniref:Methylosome subunit pICln n=1 Tax=Clathrus columnatus TaxID=1419009 RepID=A0AAV5A1P6_9AGAM|nr:hypothetical protein Clacol_002767 [Clathrus columnatus]
MAPITFTHQPPRCVTISEHRQLVSSTPESFNDIPPILYHKEESLSITLDPPLPGFTEQDCTNGTLYVVESSLFFFSATGRGIQVEYPTITLHAVARGDSVPKVYCQLSEKEVQSDNEGDEQDDGMRELNLIPTEPSSVEAIFEALSTCAAMHPDSQEDEGDLDDAFIDANENEFQTFIGDDQEELSAVGRFLTWNLLRTQAALNYLESIIEDPLNFAPSNDSTDSVDLERKLDLNGVNGQK